MSRDRLTTKRNWIMTRRQLAGIAGISVLSAGSGYPVLTVSAADQSEKIVQPASATAEAFIERAIEMRRLAEEKGDQSYGAVVVRDNRIIGQSWSKVVIDGDPTAHAEISAIRDAARRTNSRNLAGAILYSSSRPCPMCEAAAYWANIQEMIYGRSGQSGGVPRLCG